jgi:hypothetical protein
MDGDGGEESPSSPFFFVDHIYKWLENAMYYGITESDFWNMTLAEINRAVEVKKRIQKEELQARASMDYILADLIGRSVARIHSSSTKLPSLAEAYPTLFDKEDVEEKIQEKKDELSVLRLRQFAQSFNSRFKEVAKNNG